MLPENFVQKNVAENTIFLRKTWQNSSIFYEKRYKAQVRSYIALNPCRIHLVQPS